VRHLCVVFALGALSSTGESAELRGLWVVRTALVSPQAVDRLVDHARAGGFNALFVQVRGRGDAFYDSGLVPRSLLLEGQPSGFDPLGRLLERAHKQGLAVHAWVNVLLTAHFGQPLPKGHVVTTHPDWVMVPRSIAWSSVSPNKLTAIARLARSEGDAEGYYLSPTALGVAEHLEEVVREIVRRYPVEGLHLDFIRYPGPEYDYSQGALEAFCGQHGRDKDLLRAPLLAPEAWEAFQKQALSSLADRLARAARAERRLVVSGAVVPDPAEAVHHKYQDWPMWASSGILDAVCPMAYTPDPRIFETQIQQARPLTGAAMLWAGVGAYRLSLSETVSRIRTARKLGAVGVVIFSHESFGPEDWRRLREEAFPSQLGAPAGSGGSVRAAPR